MSRSILTLPMMPVDGSNYGKFVTPIICETLSNILDCDYHHCINILDSFNDRTLNLNEYITSLDENDIHYSDLWYDYLHVEELVKNINILIEKGYIFEVDSSVYKCECGVIEIEKNKIHTCNPNNLKFNYNDGKMICKSCGSICKEYKEKVLAFSPFGVELKDIKVLPKFLNKDIKTYEKTVLNSYTTISRDRNTGVSINYNNKKYNIDIDFLWGTYLSTFPEKEKIVVSGNRMLYQLFMVETLEKCLEPENSTILIGTPYLTNIKFVLDNPNFICDEKLRKLLIIFSTKWKNKDSSYDESTIKFLNRLSVEERRNLYDIINMPIDSIDFFNDTNQVLRERFNMQNNVKKIKIERR